jgi:ribosome-binding ATPase YchF (GTP1/OBG family)
MEKWDEEFVKKVVAKFIEERFPTILVLNKIDTPESDQNVAKIYQKYDPVILFDSKT